MPNDINEQFLMGDEKKSKEVKFNIFKFQDHLLEWIFISAQHFQVRDYPSSFEALTIVYTDAQGFFEVKEVVEIDKLFEKARDATQKYINYNIDYQNVQRRIKQQIYNPPSDIYFALLNFRIKLMRFMAKRNMLMVQVRKGMEGAGAE